MAHTESTLARTPATRNIPWCAVIVLLAAFVGLVLATWGGVELWHGVQSAAPAATQQLAPLRV